MMRLVDHVRGRISGQGRGNGSCNPAFPASGYTMQQINRYVGCGLRHRQLRCMSAASWRGYTGARDLTLDLRVLEAALVLFALCFNHRLGVGLLPCVRRCARLYHF